MTASATRRDKTVHLSDPTGSERVLADGTQLGLVRRFLLAVAAVICDELCGAASHTHSSVASPALLAVRPWPLDGDQ